MPVRDFLVVVPGDPRGQIRSRHGQGRTYKDPEQRAWDELAQMAWIKAGRPVLEQGPYGVHIVAYHKRPNDHWRASKSNIALTKAGLESLYPTGKPDLDNVVKQVDAFVAVRAVPDDVRLVRIMAEKRWHEQPGRQRTVFAFATLNPEVDDG